MKTKFIDRQDDSNPLNGTVIKDSAEIRRVLGSLRHRPPFMAELISDNGFTLMLGLGRKTGCAQYSPVDGALPYLMALAPDATDSKDTLEFLLGNIPTPVRKRYCLPYEAVVGIAEEFVRTGARKADIGWEEI